MTKTFVLLGRDRSVVVLPRQKCGLAGLPAELFYPDTWEPDDSRLSTLGTFFKFRKYELVYESTHARYYEECND